MPSFITRTGFLDLLRNVTIDVERARNDPALDEIDWSEVDYAPSDGFVRGEEEASRLFTWIDSYGRNDDSDRMDLETALGQPTRAATQLAALGQLTNDRGIQGAVPQVPTSAAVDWTAYEAPDGARASPEAMRGAAAQIIREVGESYAVNAPWINLDPQHALPTGRPIEFLNGRWKCNLFGGNVLRQAGFEPPYYGNRGEGEYPLANAFYRWSDVYAPQFGNRVHFELVGELDLESLSERVRSGEITRDEQRETIRELLAQARAGDLVTVDHLGDEQADGGHTRVVMGNDGSGVIHFAQARFNGARVLAENVSSFTGEEHVWILRPNRPAGY